MVLFPDLLFLFQVKLLKSISDILPLRERTRREAKVKNGEKGSKPAQSLTDENENRNPNLSTPPLGAKTVPKKSPTQLDDLNDNLAKCDRKRGLKSSFSARNLIRGREILSQITEFCAELKKMALKTSKKGVSEKASDGVLERVRKQERLPLLVLKQIDSRKDVVAFIHQQMIN
ncbi:hypothetical protein PTKIN_Ptkin06aG0089400 [Pterospermum kingtungense]